MASNTGEDVVSGEDLDVILELLESEFLDEEIEILDAFEEAVSQIEDSDIECEICGKKCRSKCGLTRHKNTKHKVASTHEVDSFSIEDYCQLVSQCVESLSNDECYSEDVRTGFQEYVFVYAPQDHDLESIAMFGRIKKLYNSLEKKGNVEQFYSTYFALVPLKAAEYFPGLPFQSSVLLATRLADKIVSFFKEKKAGHTPTARANSTSLSVKEKSALQYLGGYVLFSLNKRSRKSPKWKSISGQQAIALRGFTGRQGEDSSTAQNLIDCLNRGGLWKITVEVEQIFAVAEIHFKSMTSGNHIVKIDKDEIASSSC
eukprot:gene4330-4903_t